MQRLEAAASQPVGLRPVIGVRGMLRHLGSWGACRGVGLWGRWIMWGGEAGMAWVVSARKCRRRRRARRCWWCGMLL